MKHRTLASAACLAWAVATPTAAFADADSCAALAGATLDNVTIESAVLQAEGAPVAGANIADTSGMRAASSFVPIHSICTRERSSSRARSGRSGRARSAAFRTELWIPGTTPRLRATWRDNGPDAAGPPNTRSVMNNTCALPTKRV
jgi:hypothetical protein